MPFAIESTRGKCTNVTLRCLPQWCCCYTSLSAYVELPSIADGYWKMVDRNPGTSAYTNVSLCVYDRATGAAYLLTMDI